MTALNSPTNQQQNELDKAITLLEQMVVRFPAKQVHIGKELTIGEPVVIPDWEDIPETELPNYN